MERSRRIGIQFNISIIENGAPHFKCKMNLLTIELTQLNLIMSTFKLIQIDSEVNRVPIEYIEI